MNPILSKEYFVPDGEPRVWEDGRLYIYGSCDKVENQDTEEYCSYEYSVYSTDDLMNWVDHGTSFCSKDDEGNTVDVPWATKRLFAPDCIYKEGKYYLYFCMQGNDEGVAVSDRPYGPFMDAVPIEGAHLDAIDPAVFIDDDGQAYYYWGQYNCRAAKLNSDMKTLDITSINYCLIDEEGFGFHEGPSMRKRKGLYYLIYTDTRRGKATCLSYAVSKSPMGPFEKGGVIIDNDGCDKATWNNHGSIVAFKGQWYIIYHRSVFGSRYVRRACIEPIYFDEKGTIKEVEMTTQGASSPLDARGEIDAYRACLLKGEVVTVQKVLNNGEREEYLASMKEGDIAVYKYLDFKDGLDKIAVWISCNENVNGAIEIRIDSLKGKKIGLCSFETDGSIEDFKRFETMIEMTDGIHGLYFIFHGNGYTLRSFCFY